MSHLTAPMPPQSGHRQLQKSYLFDLPRPVHPLTPPETDYDTPSQTLPAQNLTGLESEPLPGLPPHFPPSSVNDSPLPFGTLHRKRSSVTYVNSGIREARERVVQRGLKWLVVVVPPVSFAREHGHLGHTLSSGSSKRLSSGLLVPLYPTLNSQLGAIAREFSFPSITGLCVYLHTTHTGIALTPRVSDESWPLLWNHLFDARSPSLPPQQLPISGQIEFDIDLTRARWYDSWIASSRREYADVPQSVAPSRPQSLSHWRGDSQTSINEPLDDQTDVMSIAQQVTNKGPARNIKKLSLLDRFDAFSTRSGSKLALRDESTPEPTARQDLASQALSPIVQEDEPATAKKHIDNRVQSWRMSATAAARSPLAATGQTSLDPANMPNNIEDLPTGTGSEFELNLDDYTWSVSSVGPADYEVDMQSVYSWDRVPSVHLDRRGEGSVCLTASVCTSFGPDDEYVPLSPSSSRLPSPDIAWRMLEDAPPTPTTATSWGAPLSFPPSPTESSYAPSIDIAARFLSSRPVTPTTATSWGAPLSFPPSPIMVSRPISPDMGERVVDSVPSSPLFRGASRPFEFVFPYHNTAPYPWQHVWPYVENGRQHADASPWQHVWPYAEGQQQADASAWHHVWPYVEQADRMNTFAFLASATRSAFSIDLGYPVLNIYPAVYPSFDIYPGLTTLDDRKLGASMVNSGAAYPIFDLYPAVYPSLVVYPAVLTVTHTWSKEISMGLSYSYPTIEPYPAATHPAVCKHVDIANIVDDSAPTVSIYTATGYPVFDIYPSVYPHYLDNIYPAVHASTSTSVSSVQVRIRLPTLYPSFDIYPSVYPYISESIYPSVISNEVRSPVVSVGVELQYPTFSIYPPVSVQASSSVVVGLQTAYPTFDIYPSVYPWSVNEIYPIVPLCIERNTGIVVSLEPQYPVLNIYPAVYPYSLEAVYFASTSLILKQQWPSVRESSSVFVEPPVVYPNLCPYPAVYPYFSIYPATDSEEVSRIPYDVSGHAYQYPYLVVYPSVYPFVEIYPGSWNHTIRVSTSQTTTARRRPKYSHMQLREQVLSELKETSVIPPSPQIAARRRSKYSHMALRAQVFAEAQRFTSTSPVPTTSKVVRAPSPPSSAPSRTPASRPPPLAAAPPVSETTAAHALRTLPTHIEHDESHLDEHITVPTIVAVEPSPTASNASPASPVLFEMVTAPSPSGIPALARSRSRSGTVSTRPPVSSPAQVSPRPMSARPPSAAQSSPTSEIPDVLSPQRSLNRLSGLPAHPAVNRRISAAALPRPMSTFGPLPAVPQQSQSPAPTLSSSVRRQASMMSPLAEESSSPMNGRSPQLPSPPEEWERGWRTPTEPSSASPLATSGTTAVLSRSKTMPTRAAPRGPRSSTLVSERAKAFDNPSVATNIEVPLKLTMSALAEFPTPPRPSVPGSTTSPSRAIPSKLDRSKYPFA